MKKFICFAILCMMLLSACSSPDGGAPQDSSAGSASVSQSAPAEESSSSESPQEEPGGKSLVELGYRVVLPETLEVTGNPNSRKYVYIDEPATGEEVSPGSCTVMNVTFIYPNGAASLPFMYLQGYTPDEMKEPFEVRVGEKTLSPAELEPYQVYENDSITVYDFGPLVLQDAFEDTIQAQVDKINEGYDRAESMGDYATRDKTKPDPLKAEDYVVLNEIQAYIKENIAQFIQKQP